MKCFKFMTILFVLSMMLVAGCDKPQTVKTTNTDLESMLASASHVPTCIAGETDPTAGVTVAKLPNGLTVIIKAMRTAPVVNVRCYVRCGGLTEKEYLGKGLSHVLEHLVAQDPAEKGDDVNGKKTRILEIGGQSNAYTTNDHTCYYIAAAASKAMQCIDLISDEMLNDNITLEDYEREYEVVQRELEMGKDDVGRQIYYAHSADVFGSHPAAIPTIGYLSMQKKVTIEDITTYHSKMYTPQNMVFVVVGDIDEKLVYERIKNNFAAMEKGPGVDLTLPEVKAFSGIRKSDHPNKAIKEEIGRISFQSIPLMHEDLYALDVLSFVLSRGESSRLYKRVVLGAIGTEIFSSSWTPAWGKGIFTIGYRCSPAKSQNIENAIFDELRKVIAKKISPAELARAKKQKLAETVFSKQTAESVATELATDYLSTGNIIFTHDYNSGIQKVTAEEIQRVAKKYLTFDKYVHTRLVPEGVYNPIKTAISNAKTQKTNLITLDNGLRVLLKPTTSVDLVSMAFVAPGGLVAETPKTNGLGTMMMTLSTKGAGDRTANEIAAFFDQAGGSISGQSGNNSFYWQASVLHGDFPTALEILADIVIKPTFPQKQLDTFKPLFIQGIKRIDQDWYSQMSRFYRKNFFGKSPYSMTTRGSEKVIASANVKMLADWHKNNIAAGSSVLAIYGNFDVNKTTKSIEELFKNLPAGKITFKNHPPAKVAKAGRVHVLKTTNRQAGIMVAVPGMKVSNVADRLAITVLDTIISGYRLPSGWLHTELRGKKLVYVVHAYNWAGLAPGAFLTYAGTQPDKALEVAEIIRKNYRKASTYVPSEMEVKRAINVILTATALGNQTMSSQAMASALDEVYGLGYDHSKKEALLYEKITPKDVARVAKKYLAGGYVTIITTPNPELIEAKTDKTTEKSKK